MDGLEIFSFGPLGSDSYASHLADKNGATVATSLLHSADVVGVYFSAHWCGPCRSFTPKLVDMYNECKEQGKRFEVVFVSSDQDEKAFDEYYAEMPWLHLRFDRRDLKEAISNLFDVQGIPTLVLLTGKGVKITDDGRLAVQGGSDYFPWGEAELLRAEEEKARKEKEQEVQ